MPEWLLKDDNYMPQHSKDTFINKSILTMLKILTKFRTHTQNQNNKYKINTISIAVSTIMLIILISLSQSFVFILTVGVFILLLTSLLNVEKIKYIIKLDLAVGLFTFIVFIPSFLYGNINNGIIVVIKVILSVTSINILSSVSQWNDIIRTLKIFFVPDIFVFIIDITIKYILILGEFSLNMLYALKTRSIGKIKNNNSSLSAIIGTMFIKSKEMAQDMNYAMECRGFTGKYKINKNKKLYAGDYFCIIFDIVLILVYIYFKRL